MVIARRVFGLLCLGVCLAAPLPALGQAAPASLSQLVPDLILKGITLPGAGDPGTPHAGHFTLGNPTFGGSQAASRPDLAAIAAVEAFNDRLKGQLATFPLGSSSGGFTFVFDSALGASRPRSRSFGPAFAERAATLGRSFGSLGFNYQHVGFDSFGGENLNDRSITFYLPHTDCCSAAAPPPSSGIPGFEGDLVEAALKLKASTDTFAIFASYGITDKLDIGIAIPFSRVRLDADVRATIIRLATSATPLVHTFVTGQDVPGSTFTISDSASGLGDMVVKTKYNFLSRNALDLAAAVDLRLPTGDEDNLLGLGTTQAKFYMVVSTESGRLMPHANIGFTVSGKGTPSATTVFSPLGVSDEFNYTAGIEAVVHSRVTLVGDVLGRTLFDAGTVKAETKTYDFRAGAGSNASVPLSTSSTNPLSGQPYRQLALTPGNLNLALGTVGAKVNVTGKVLLLANVLFPLTGGGLRDRAAVTFGLDFAF